MYIYYNILYAYYSPYTTCFNNNTHYLHYPKTIPLFFFKNSPVSISFLSFFLFIPFPLFFFFFFFNDPPPPEIYPFPLHAPLPIYVHFVRDKTLLEAIASSLTELFSPVIIGERVEGMLKGYPFVTAETLAFFAKRPPQAKKDSD